MLESSYGVRANLPAFTLLVVQVALVGAVVGVERTVLPILAGTKFGLTSKTAALSFILAFGIAKAPGNHLAGILADRFGRRRVLIGGWLIVLPVPLMIGFAPSWEWVIAANVLLGMQQALCWSASIFMKVDLAGARRRGAVIGINEFAGYAGLAVAAYAASLVAESAGAQVAPFLFTEGLAMAGLLTAFKFAEDTSLHGWDPRGDRLLAPRLRDARIPFAALSQAGFATKLVDVAAWGLLPMYFSERGLSLATIGLLAAAYPASSSLLQPLTGALSDAAGRTFPIVAGMLVQALGLAAIALSGDFGGWLLGLTILGAGTALVYPVLLAAAGDVATPQRRASSIGLYRLWRDLGFVGGALAMGLLADGLGIEASLIALAGIVVASGALVAVPTRTPRAATGARGRR